MPLHLTSWRVLKFSIPISPLSELYFYFLPRSHTFSWATALVTLLEFLFSATPSFETTSQTPARMTATKCLPSQIIPSLKQSAIIPLCPSKSWVLSLRAESLRHLRDTRPLPSSFPLSYWSTRLYNENMASVHFPHLNFSFSFLSHLLGILLIFYTSFKSYFRDIFGTVFTYFLTL